MNLYFLPTLRLLLTALMLPRNHKQHQVLAFSQNLLQTTATAARKGHCCCRDKVSPFPGQSPSLSIINMSKEQTFPPPESSTSTAITTTTTTSSSSLLLLLLSSSSSSSPASRVSLEEYFPDQVSVSDCPPGYYLDSVENSCHKLSPIGTLSQKVETSTALFRRMYKTISNLFGIDPHKISSLGVGFALSYSILSTINGSITLSVAWYMAARKTGLSPLAPGQWKSLLSAYGTLYAFLQVIKPFRVAAAIAMSKLSKEFLDQTQSHLGCSRRMAIAAQYFLGWAAWLAVTGVGISVASIQSGIPIFARAAG